MCVIPLYNLQSGISQRIKLSWTAGHASGRFYVCTMGYLLIHAKFLVKDNMTKESLLGSAQLIPCRDTTLFLTK